MSVDVTNIESLLAQGNYKQAHAALDNSPNNIQPDAEHLLLRAKTYSAEQRHAKAAKYYELLAGKRQLNANEAHALALELRLSGKAQEALAIFDDLYQSGIQNYALDHNTANAYYDLGQVEQAIQHYRSAIAKNPNYVPSHENLNRLLWELGDEESLFSSYKHSLAEQPDQNALQLSYLTLLLKTDSIETAQAVLNSLPQSTLNLPEFIGIQSQICSKNGEHALAKTLIESNFGKVQFHKEQIIDYVEMLLIEGDYGRASEFLTALQAVHPKDQLILAHLSFCQKQIDQTVTTPLTNYQDLVQAFDIGDYIDRPITEFCQELTDYIKNHHTTDRQPLEQSLRQGTQSKGNLFFDQHPLVQQAVQAFSKCIQSYMQTLSELEEPYPGYCTPGEFEFSGSWSVRLKDGGFHAAHMHPMGWLSSVFYLGVPSVCKVQGTKQGWLHFGIPNFAPAKVEYAQRCIQPQQGRLVLFPSYMWHGTFPFDAPQERITIAYDVIKT